MPLMKWLKYTFVSLYYLYAGLGLFVWLNVLAPLAFLADCSVRNNTHEVIWITPVGTVGKEGRRCLLPLYRTSFPFFMLSRRGHFRVEPRETFLFTYDMDDINFSELVIEGKSGVSGQIIVNPNPTTNQYIIPDTTHFTIDDWGMLSELPNNVRDCALKGRQRGHMGLMYLVLAIPLMIEGLRFARRYGRRQSHSAADASYVD